MKGFVREFRGTNGEENLRRRVMFGEVVVGGGHSFGQENDWMGYLKEFRHKSEGWREAAQKAGRWFRWVEDRTEAYMRK